MSGEDPRLSSTVGEKYRVVRFIAEGGMGAVYEAQHLFVRRRFAIKFLHRDLAHRRDVLARFSQEARAAGALEHENVAAVVDFGVAGDGSPYLVMEYLDGLDLAQLLASAGPLPSERAADLVLQAALGIQAVHAAHLIHRDLKPQNLFLCRRSDGTDLVKVLDFGVAKLQTPGGAVTRSGAMLGTPAYMSPEQARGEATLDSRTDIYALGVILYELLTGSTPHPGDSHNAVVHHIATQGIVPLASEGRELPQGLVELVHRALSAAPALRPASAVELAEALRGFARRATWPDVSAASARSDAGVESTLLAVGDGAGQRPQSLSASLLDSRDRGEKARARDFRAWLVGLAISGLAVLGVWLANRSQTLPPQAAPAAPPTTLKAALSSRGTAPEPVQKAPNSPERPGQRAPSVESPAVEATSAERPPAVGERPRGRPAPPSAGARRPNSTPVDDIGASFDDRNPYK